MSALGARIAIASRSDLDKLSLKITPSIEYGPEKKATVVRFFFVLSYTGSEYFFGVIPVKGSAQSSDSRTIPTDERTNFDMLINEVSKKAKLELENIKSEIKDILGRGAPQVTIYMADMLARIGEAGSS